jgi:N-acetylmuramoyl-L-alanine amidase
MTGTVVTLAVTVMGVLLHILWVLDGVSTVETWSRMIDAARRGEPAVAAEPAPEVAPAVAVAPTAAPRPRLVDVGLDPGHSNADPGALGGGMRECDLTLPLARRVKALLEEQGLVVVLTRSDDRPLSSMSARDPTDRVREEQEARIAAAGDTRIYVSLHFNGHPDRSIRGIETYFNPSNREEESRRLAGSIQRHLIASVRATGYGVPDRGVKEDLSAGKPYGHFFSLRGGAPSVLVEAMFMTNPLEAWLLAQPDTLEAVAKGIATGIAEHLSGGR